MMDRRGFLIVAGFVAMGVPRLGTAPWTGGVRCVSEEWLGDEMCWIVVRRYNVSVEGRQLVVLMCSWSGTRGPEVVEYMRNALDSLAQEQAG